MIGWLLLSAIGLSPVRAQSSSGGIHLTFPVSRMIVQRDNNNQATVQLGGSYDAPVDKVEARAVARVAGQGTTTDWVALTPAQGQFSGTMVIRGGWYQLEVRAFKNNVQVGSDVLDRFGVGEVFAIVGHSDAQGSGCYLNGTDYCPSIDGASDDRVTAVGLDQSSPEFYTYLNTADTRYLPGLAFRQLTTFGGISPFAKMAWFWGHMGDVLVKRINVPVLLYNAGFGGSNMEQTYNAAYDIPFQHSFIRYDLRMPYANVRNLMNLYVPTTGIRAVLLNHGANDRTSASNDILKWHYGVIDKVRQEFNMPKLGWIVALASYFGGRNDNVRQAQYQTINRADYQTYLGPDMDNINSLADMPDGGHYSPSGQIKAGEAWANAITDAYLQNIQPYMAQPQPLNAIACADAQRLTLNAPAGYEYNWNTGSADRSLTVGAGQYSLRLKAPQRTVFFPPAIVVPSTINPATYGCGSTNQAPVVNGQLATLSSTVGVPFSYSLSPGLFTDPAGLALTYSYRGLPAGLTGNGSVISGSPTTSGAGNFTVTATNTAGLSASASAAYVIAAPVGQAQPPVQVSQLSALSGQVGQLVNYVIPAGAFRDPTNSPLTFSYRNLPVGLSGSGLTVSGTPVGAGSGQFTLLVTNLADMSLSVQVNYSIAAQVTTPPSGALTMIAPLYNCATGAITFQTTGGNGSLIEYRSVGITDWSSNPNQFLDRDARVVSDTPPFQLYARQSGQVASYTWSRQAFCAGVTTPPTTPPVSTTTAPPPTPPVSTTTTPPPTPPVSTTTAPPTSTTTAPSSGALTMIAPLYNCATGAITFQTSGGNGSLIEYSSPGITDWTTNPNQLLDRDARTVSDIPPFQLNARQSGRVVSYTWSRQAFCAGVTTPPTTPPVSTTTTPPPTPPVSTTTAPPPTPPVSTTTAPPTSTTTAPSSGALTIIAPLYNCATGAITFQTTGGNGSLIEYSSPGITDWTTNPNQLLDRDARTVSDIPPFQLNARQSGRVVSYTWSRQAFCAGVTTPPTTPPVSTTTTPPPTPPVSTTTAPPPTPPVSTTTAPPTSTTTAPSSGALTIIAPLYNCATGAITFQTTGGNGSLIEYSSPGITDWTTNPNQLLDRDARTVSDIPPFQLNARQSGRVVSYTWSRQAFCAGVTTPPTTPPVSTTTTPPPTPPVSTTTAPPPTPPVSTTTAPPTSTTTAPSSGALTMIAPLYNCATGAITFQTTGGNGTLIEYSSVGITDWSSNPNQFLDRDARVVSDTPPFQLNARQSGRVVSYTWSRQAYCARARVSAEGSESLLSVQVLGNPVTGSTVDVLVTGAAGQHLTLEVIDFMGHLLHQQSIESAQAQERAQLGVGHAPGMLLLRATTPTQQQTVKLVRP